MGARDRAKIYREITEIVDSMLSVANQYGVVTVLAQSGIPVLKTLGPINAWWADRKARAKVPQDVAEELGRIYGFDGSDTTERAVIEQRLADAGVHDPDDAYELAWRRLTARIQHTELVDYLAQEFKTQRGAFQPLLEQMSGALRHLVCVVGRKPCLRRIEDVLAVHPDPDRPFEWNPTWFRRSGPLTVDFNNERVCPRPDEEERLAEALQARRTVVLEGDAATGKSVLARTVAYRFYQEEVFPEIYYLECREHQNLDAARLCDEARDVDGLIVIEDAHLAPGIVSCLVSRLRGPSPRLLLTTRPSLWEMCDRRDEALKALRSDALPLPPFAEVDRIVAFYAERNPESDGKPLPWSLADRDAVKRASEKSFWLLAYALEGYVAERGEGEPGDWVAKGVQEELRDLEKENPEYPNALVALSPLYMGECMTAESFLTGTLKLGVGPLNDLVARGEVTCQEDGAGRYYGLPHSALADAYWRHGEIYHNRAALPGYEEFLYRYAASGAPNALAAAMSADRKTSESLMARFSREGMLAGLIERESSVWPLATWAAAMNGPDSLQRKVITALAERLSRAEEPFAAGVCISEICRIAEDRGLGLIEALDTGELAGRLVRTQDIHGAGVCIGRIWNASEDKGRELWAALDIGEMADRISRAENLRYAGSCIWSIFRASEAKGRELWAALDIGELAHRLSRTEDMSGAGLCIASIFDASEKKGRELWGLVNNEELKRYCRDKFGLPGPDQ